MFNCLCFRQNVLACGVADDLRRSRLRSLSFCLFRHCNWSTRSWLMQQISSPPVYHFSGENLVFHCSHTSILAPSSHKRINVLRYAYIDMSLFVLADSTVSCAGLCRINSPATPSLENQCRLWIRSTWCNCFRSFCQQCVRRRISQCQDDIWHCSDPHQISSLYR